MNKYLLGIDIGTTSVKSTICDLKEYKIVCSTSTEHNLLSPFPGWAEENPDDWWKNTQKTINTCLLKSKVEPKQIVGIGVSGMVPALVLLDNNGLVIRPSIQQNDSRTYNEIKIIEKAIGNERIFNITGSVINQQMISPKILWIKKNEKKIFSRTYKILGSYDYIVYKLTNVFSLEQNWALESGLYNIKQKNWSEEILDVIGLKKDLLSKINKPTSIVGTITKEAAKLTGLYEGIPVVAGTADHVASAFMAGIQNTGDLLLKFGGAGDILYSTDSLITDKRLFIDYHLIPDKYLINGCMASSGSLLKWFREQFCNNKIDFDILDKAADKIEAGSEGLITLPYFIGEKTPIFDPLARGVFFGLTLHHTKYHIYRSILEAVGYGFKHHTEILQEKGLEIKNVIATNGGSISKIWGKMISSILGFPINYLKHNPGASLGAAFISGISLNYIKNWSETKNFIEISHTIYPDKKDHKIYQKYFNIYKKIYLSLKDLYGDLNEISGR